MVWNKPIYCKDCNSRNTFERNPSGDIYGTKGIDTGLKGDILMWESYKCRRCGNKTIRRV